MKRIALFVAMKLISWFDLEVDVLELLTPKPVPMPEVDKMVPITYDSRGITPEKEVKKIKKELPKKPLQKKKVKR